MSGKTGGKAGGKAGEENKKAALAAKASAAGPFANPMQVLKSDFPASVVVFLVALPLCMGIAMASGVPPALGLITGIVGGLVVGFLAGSPLQVSGPAAGLAVLVLQFVETYGLALLGVAVLAAGVLQLVAGALRIGTWFRAVSPAVIGGMLGGIGVLIFASQFHVMVDDTPRGGGLANLLSIPEAVYKGIFPVDGTAHHLAAMIGVITLGSIVLWTKFKPKALAPVPAPLVAVLVATFAAWVGGFFINGEASLPIQYVSVPESLVDSLNMPTLASFSSLLDWQFVVSVLGLAAIASAETLLCATAVDKLHTGPRTKYDKELMAQGVGNMICGVFGALPMTGVIVRSSANVEAGGKTRLSAILHGAWLLGLVALAPFVLRAIPTAALAGILVYTGYRLLNIPGIVKLWKARPSEAVVQVGTLTAIVATDLLTGVLIGIGLALLKLLYSFSKAKALPRFFKTFAGLNVDVKETDGKYDVHLSGAATFIRLPILANRLEAIPQDAKVEIHLGDLSHIDHGCYDLLQSWASQRSKAAGGETVVDWDTAEKRSHAVVLTLPGSKDKHAA
ncbi:MAG: SulP family inorganic anion transporter [Myxococcota bacterium]